VDKTALTIWTYVFCTLTVILSGIAIHLAFVGAPTRIVLYVAMGTSIGCISTVWLALTNYRK